MKSTNNDVISFYIKTDKKPRKKAAMQELNLSLDEFTDYSDLISSIQVVRALHQSIKKRSGEKYKFNGFNDFYNWYMSNEKVCCYCGISQEKLTAIKLNGWETKRRRGAKLEVERVDADLNEYSSNNCALACYFCNNHKSDIITEDDYKDFFEQPMRAYLEKLARTAKPGSD
jgi:hypothetical protein